MTTVFRVQILLVIAIMFLETLLPSQFVSSQPLTPTPVPPRWATPLSTQDVVIQALRAKLAQKTYRAWNLPQNLDKSALAAGLGETGHFAELADIDSEEFQKKLQSESWEVQDGVSSRLRLALNQTWVLAETLRNKPRPLTGEDRALQQRLFQAVVYYGALEQKRPNNGTRFHASCFAIPLAAVNIYFSFFPEMNAVEEDKGRADTLSTQAHGTLLALGLQTWTVPARGDATDANPISVERFRKHVWWVGGNALAYRPVLAVALMHRSSEMLSVLSQVASGAISVSSAATWDTAFWTEGMTVDGSGWAHGRQNQPFAYPFDGTEGALDIMEQLQGTPWEKPLTTGQVDVLLNYIRGSSWFYYKGCVPPVVYRANMIYGEGGPKSLKTKAIANQLLRSWREELKPGQTRELESVAAVSGEKGSFPLDVERSNYRGARYFWNQDALAVKSESHYMLVNMASNRKDGLESTTAPAAAYNLFTNDGHTLFYRDGKEYSEAIGAWNLTALPGVTARQGEDQLHPVTNWRGYNSLYPFAGGVARGENGCAGFIFEKHNASCPTHVNDRCGADDPNTTIYGVKAHKAWFVVGNSLLALGTGITNAQPELLGDIWTTINQTSWRTEVMARDGEGQVQEAPRPDGTNREWRLLEQGGKNTPVIWHDGFTYKVFPQYTMGQVKATVERRSTKWEKLAADNKKQKTPAQADIFQLWIDHGAHPKGASYAYMVAATEGNPKMELQTPSPLSVLSNTEAVQAVRSEDGRIIQAVFYQASGRLLFDGYMMAVSAPCVLMMENASGSNAGDEWLITVNDPEQLISKKSIQLVTDAPFSGPSVSKTPDGRQVVTITLPGTPLLGKPTTVRVSLQKPLNH